MSAQPSKPPSRKPVTAFIAKPKESATKDDKDFIAKLEEKMDRIFEARSKNLKAPETTDDTGFQDVNYKIRTTKEKTKITDYSKDLSDHEESADGSIST